MQCFVCFVNFSFLLHRVFRGSRYTRQLLDFVVVFARDRTITKLSELCKHHFWMLVRIAT